MTRNRPAARHYKHLGVYGLIIWVTVLGLKDRALAHDCVKLLLETAAVAVDASHRLIQTQEPLKDIGSVLKSVKDIVIETQKSGIADLEKVLLVIYPMAGADAGTAAALFPNAKTIIGIDMVKFGSSSKEPFISSPKSETLGAKLGYAPYQEMDLFSREEDLAPALVHSLRSYLPNFRLRKITMFGNSKGFYDPDIEKEKDQGRNSGIIEFDSGEGTPLRRYIHLNDFLSGIYDHSLEQETIELQLKNIFQNETPDAVLIKASMGKLRSIDTDKYLNGERKTLNTTDDSLRSAILKWLRNSHGVLVEGVEQVVSPKQKDLPEFTGIERFPGTKSITVSTPRFGYTGKVHITKF